MSITCCQYAATSGKLRPSQMYTKLRISFWKQLPPKPIDACKNFEPIRESKPTAFATSVISAPVASHTADSELMLDILCAKNALAAWKSTKIQLLNFSYNLNSLIFDLLILIILNSMYSLSISYLLLSNADIHPTTLQWLEHRIQCIRHQLKYDRRSINLRLQCLQPRIRDLIEFHT